MEKSFVCSLCHNGILGGTLYLDGNSVTYKTNKLTVDQAYRNLVLPLKEIKEITWKWIVFPIATFHMKNGEEYRIIIKKRYYDDLTQMEIAKEFNVSQAQISRIEKEAINKLKENLDTV